MEKEDFVFIKDQIQEQIGYQFKNLALLKQAFVRRSHSEENGGEDNEVLEFIGDKVLDFVIVKILAEKYGSFTSDNDEFISDYKEGKLTEIKQKLVEKKMLAHRIDLLEFANHLIMGNSDIQRNVGEEMSVKEDLFEAIVGAVALDCGWDMKEIQSTVEIMLDPDSYLSENPDENFVELIQEWTLKRYNTIPSYDFMNRHLRSSIWFRSEGTISSLTKKSFEYFSSKEASECNFTCLLKSGDTLPVFEGYGKSKSDARKDVCEFAYKYLEQNNLLLSIQDEIDNPNKDEAINQLEILSRRGYFSIPTYQFIEEYDNNGNPIWKCECHIIEKSKFFGSKSSSKKDAKKSAAFKMLNYVLNNK